MQEPFNRTDDFESRLSPFLTLLTTCVCESRENVVTTLAIRCIALLLKRGVEPSPDVLSPLGAKIIDILSKGDDSHRRKPRNDADMSGSTDDYSETSGR